MKALYIGSFDPFTNGHLDIIKQAENIFDEVLIVVATNSNKKRRFTVGSCMSTMAPLLGKNTQLGVSNNALTTDIMGLNNCDYLIRGLRNTSDYLYEEQLFQIYKELKPDIRVMYLRANNNISSSFVYELMTYNKSVDDYVPYDINKLTYSMV